MNTDTDPVPASVRRIIGGIAEAVRAGDDSRIRVLLERLAQVADTDALLLLRHQLNQDLGREPPHSSRTSDRTLARD
ncbi:hypothetical protein ABCR94_37680 [Streptomyces sp. 21So2-11]|uniref:hypothetical protein n=1 Tax=Streptomyces sp. 21So2-11 TaxID=3144408 RepID=UPI00321ABD41